MSTRRVHPKHRVIHAGDRTRSNAFHRDLLGAEVPHTTAVGVARHSPGVGHPDLHGPGAALPPPARVPLPPDGGRPCSGWPAAVAEAAVHPARRAVSVELGPVHRPGGRGFVRGAYVHDPDGSSPDLIPGSAP